MIRQSLSKLSRPVQRLVQLRQALSPVFNFSSNTGSAVKLKLDLKNLGKQIKQQPNFDKSVNGKHFDIAVIGGGSGGLSLVLEAQKLGLKTVVFDYVDPTLHGTKWGIGGTCVNVGCIPKKLMHQAAIHKEWTLNSYDFGLNLGEFNDPDDHFHEKLNKAFDWNRLVRNIQLHIKSINFEYVSNFKENGTPYINGLASFYDANTLIYSSQKKFIDEYIETDKFDPEKLGKVTANHIIVAVGGRPTYMSEDTCSGQNHMLTSDDIFSLNRSPDKTLVVGGGYIALECAGFLRNLGYPVTVMNRTDVFLRGFDTDMSRVIIEFMKRDAGIDFIPWTLPNLIETNGEGRFAVKYKSFKDSKEGRDEFDTILLAIGRTPNTKLLNLNKAGVKINDSNQKIVGGHKDEFEKTSVDHIYAVGDCLDKVPELTPIAQKSGQNLAKRLYLRINQKENSKEFSFYKMDYKDFPTTVFTPIEYSCCGYSEEQAIQEFGKENIQVYHSRFTPLEQTLIMRNHPADGESLKMKGYAKIVCNIKDNERIVGIHYTGPNAGEVMQGYAVALKLGMTRHDLHRTVGIHPTTSEEFIVMNKTKDEDPEKTSC